MSKVRKWHLCIWRWSIRSNRNEGFTLKYFMVYLLDFAAVMATLFSIGGVWWGSVNFLPHLLVMFLMSVWTCWWSSPWSTTAEPAATSPRRSSSLSVSSTSSMPGSSSPSTRPDSPTGRVHWAMGSARSSLWYSTAQWEPQCWHWLWWVQNFHHHYYL